MWPVSSQWDSGWRAGGVVTVVAEVWSGGSRQTLPDGSTSLRVTGGTLTIDESSKVRRSLSLTVANTDLDPVGDASLLTPFGTDIKLWVGITYTDGSTELAPCGVFRLTAPARPSVFQPLTLAASDYAAVMQRARFLAPWVTNAGTLVTAEIAAMAQSAVPGQVVVDLTGSRAVTSAATWDRDRWDAMTALAQSIGAECFFDPQGQLIIRAVPSTVMSTVWTCDAGTSTAVMTDVATGLSSDSVYNAVVATSTPPNGSPVTAVAYQTTGKLAWSNVKLPRFWATPLPMSYDGLCTAASSILAKSVAYSRAISPSAVWNPALDVGDPIRVVLPSGSSENRRVSRIVLPLSPEGGPMQLDTRVAADVALTAYASGLS